MWLKTVRSTVLVAAWAIVLGGLAGCASPRGGVADPGDQWLTSKGFAARGDWNSTALHLRKQQLRSTLRISQLIRRVPGVRLQPNRGNPLGLTRILDGNRRSCSLQVYLNGVRMAPQDSAARVDLDARVGLPDLDALELHLGPDGPVHDPEGCGSLLLWDHSMQHVNDPAFLGGIRGQVEGEPPGTVVGVRLGSGGPLQRPDSAGFFSFSGLLPGEYELEIVVPGRPVLRHTTRVYAYTESQVRVRRRRDDAPRSRGTSGRSSPHTRAARAGSARPYFVPRLVLTTITPLAPRLP